MRLGFLEPMKARVAPAPPFNGEWMYEVKFDGYRVLAVKDGKRVALWSRNKKRLDERFPGVKAAVSLLPAGRCIVDGEVCALDGRGHSSFQLLQNSAETPRPVVYYVFDLLFLDRRDLRAEPLLERKRELEALLREARAPIRSSAFFLDDPGRVLRRMRAAGTEGAIAKQTASPYECGRRSGAWIKIKFHKSQEFVVVGYTLPKNSRPYFGCLLLGYYRGKDLIFAGRAGTGFTRKTLRDVHLLLKPLRSAKPLVREFQEPSARWRPKGWAASDNRWVKPRIVCQVRFTEWTQGGLLRHPAFLGLREDKDPKQVVREP